MYGEIEDVLLFFSCLCCLSSLYFQFSLVAFFSTAICCFPFFLFFCSCYCKGFHRQCECSIFQVVCLLLYHPFVFSFVLSVFLRAFAYIHVLEEKNFVLNSQVLNEVFKECNDLNLILAILFIYKCFFQIDERPDNKLMIIN